MSIALQKQVNELLSRVQTLEDQLRIASEQIMELTTELAAVKAQRTLSLKGKQHG